MLLPRVLFLTVFALSAITSVATAATLSFSYTFASSDILTGTVEGDLEQDNVTGKVANLRNLTATYSGLPGVTFSHLVGFASEFNLYGPPRRLLFMGFAQPVDTVSPTANLGFSLTDERTNGPIANGAVVGIFQTRQNLVELPIPGEAEALQSETFYYDHFKAAIVPEPDTWLMLTTAVAMAAIVRIVRGVSTRTAKG